MTGWIALAIALGSLAISITALVTVVRTRRRVASRRLSHLNHRRNP